MHGESTPLKNCASTLRAATHQEKREFSSDDKLPNKRGERRRNKSSHPSRSASQHSDTKHLLKDSSNVWLAQQKSKKKSSARVARNVIVFPLGPISMALRHAFSWSAMPFSCAPCLFFWPIVAFFLYKNSPFSWCESPFFFVTLAVVRDSGVFWSTCGLIENKWKILRGTKIIYIYREHKIFLGWGTEVSMHHSSLRDIHFWRNNWRIVGLGGDVCVGGLEGNKDSKFALFDPSARA